MILLKVDNYMGDKITRWPCFYLAEVDNMKYQNILDELEGMGFSLAVLGHDKIAKKLHDIGMSLLTNCEGYNSEQDE